MFQKVCKHAWENKGDSGCFCVFPTKLYKNHFSAWERGPTNLEHETKWSSLDSPLSETKKYAPRGKRRGKSTSSKSKDFLQRKARLGQFQLFLHQGHQHLSTRVCVGLRMSCFSCGEARQRWGNASIILPSLKLT